jgi:hypothetical protein
MVFDVPSEKESRERKRLLDLPYIGGNRKKDNIDTDNEA